MIISFLCWKKSSLDLERKVLEPLMKPLSDCPGQRLRTIFSSKCVKLVVFMIVLGVFDRSVLFCKTHVSNCYFFPNSEAQPQKNSKSFAFQRSKISSPVPSRWFSRWLRDRLLHLCDRLNASEPPPGAAEAAPLRAALQRCGLRPGGAEVTVAHADRGKRVSQEELGYWQEEADKGLKLFSFFWRILRFFDLEMEDVMILGRILGWNMDSISKGVGCNSVRSVKLNPT